jgi:hypothetical protein
MIAHAQTSRRGDFAKMVLVQHVNEAFRSGIKFCCCCEGHTCC